MSLHNHHRRHSVNQVPINDTPQPMSRREFLKGMGALAAGLALAGCAPKSEATGTVAKVGIAKANTYERTLIRQQMEELFDSIGGLSDVLAHGNRVAIKTNLTGGLQSGSLPNILETESFLTHPEVVRATAELLRDAGAREIFVVEAVYEPESWPYYGYEEMAKEAELTLVDLNYAEPFTDFVMVSPGTNPFVYEEFTFNPILQEIDAFVSISKMKCHNTAGVTHTMKNLVGLTPYRRYEVNPGDHHRSEFHGRPGETGRRIPRVILDLNMARPITLSVVDGVMTTEAGEGPWIPAIGPIKPGLLFAGKNPVSTDAVATAAMAFDPTADYPDEPFVNGDNHLNLAAELGIGTNRLEEIEVVGASLEEVTQQFKPSY